MKKIIAVLMVLMLSFPLAACGTKTYQVTTKNGQTYMTDGSMEYDVQSETYKFTNDKGQEVILNQADIEVIQEMDKK